MTYGLSQPKTSICKWTSFFTEILYGWSLKSKQNMLLEWYIFEVLTEQRQFCTDRGLFSIAISM